MAATTKRKHRAVKRTSDAPVATRASRRASTTLSSARTKAKAKAKLSNKASAKTARLHRKNARSSAVDTEGAASQASTTIEDMALASDVASVSGTMASTNLDSSATNIVASHSEEASSTTTTTVPSPSPRNPSPTLLTIPRELRLKIHTLTLPSCTIYTHRPVPTHLPPPNPRRRDWAGVALPQHHARPKVLTTLMLVCQTFASEIPPVFYEQNGFSFGYKSVKGLELLLSYDELAYLKSVRLEINFSRQGEAWRGWMRTMTVCLAEMQGLEEVVFAVSGGVVDEKVDEGVWGVVRALRGKAVLQREEGAGVSVDRKKGRAKTREWFLGCLGL